VPVNHWSAAATAIFDGITRVRFLRPARSFSGSRAARTSPELGGPRTVLREFRRAHGLTIFRMPERRGDCHRPHHGDSCVGAKPKRERRKSRAGGFAAGRLGGPNRHGKNSP